MLKKLICTLSAIGFALSAHTAFGDDRASLFLAGKIELISELFVNPTLGSTDLLDIVNGESARQVADVDEESNNAAGYQITMESVNGGALLHSNGTTSAPYTISYDGAATIAPGPLGTPVLVKTSGTLTGLTTANSIVLLDMTASPTAIAGTYTDTVIFNMVAL